MQELASTEMLALLGGVMLVALLYSSVGHGGASGYIALMALFGLAPVEIRPLALLLNILVSLLATIAFFRAGHFSWRIFWPFAVASIPASFFGGGLQLPNELYRATIGTIMLFCAARLFWPGATPRTVSGEPAVAVGLGTGTLLGLLSGLTGVGGGIFLSPLLLLAGWATPKVAAGVAAPFILVNSVAGLLGYAHAQGTLPALAPLLAGAALGGALAGTRLGSRHLSPAAINKVLSFVLTIAGVKLILT